MLIQYLIDAWQAFMAWGIIAKIIIFFSAFVFGFAYQKLMKLFAKKPSQQRSHNIGTADRLMRAGIGMIFLVLSGIFSWQPVLLFIAGFCFFEAIFSWCAWYALQGKSSCPL